MERHLPDPSIFGRLQNEEPMDSALNSAHFHSRRADNHLRYGRYDDAISSHKETVKFLTMAIKESTIPQNIENLSLQRKHHENIQPIITRQKQVFEDFLRRNGLKPSDPQTSPENQNQLPSNRVKNNIIDASGDVKFQRNCNDDEFFSLFEVVGELKIDEKHSDDEMYSARNGDSDGGDEEFFSLC